jgi:hypothetical protein
MRSRYSALAVSLLSMAVFHSHAASLSTSDTRVSGMGGAGVTTSTMNSAGMSQDDYRFGLTLPNVSVNLHDPKGFMTEFAEFAEDDISAYADFDFDAVSTSITGLTNSISTLVTEADDFENNPNSTTLNDLKNAQTSFETNLSSSKIQIDDLTTITKNTQSGFDDVSNRPMNLGLLANLGVALPSNKVPLSININNNMTAGFELELEQSDLDILANTLSDSGEFLGNVGDLNTSLNSLISAAEDFENNPNATTQSDFQSALSDF